MAVMPSQPDHRYQSFENKDQFVSLPCELHCMGVWFWQTHAHCSPHAKVTVLLAHLAVRSHVLGSCIMLCFPLYRDATKMRIWIPLQSPKITWHPPDRQGKWMWGD